VVDVCDGIGVSEAVALGRGVKLGSEVRVGNGVKLANAGWKGVGVALAFGSTVTRLRGGADAVGGASLGREQDARRIKPKSALSARSVRIVIEIVL